MIEIKHSKDQRKRLSTVEGYLAMLLSRAKRRRPDNFTITLDFLINKWKEQKGLCALTGLSMLIQKGLEGSKLAASINRIDSSIGYTKENSRLVCVYVNGIKGDASDEEFFTFCSRVLNNRRKIYQEQYIPNYNDFATLLDRLAIDVHKLAFFENSKREEHAKDCPNIELINKYDNASRDCCEIRNHLKSEINNCLNRIINSQNYDVKKEIRTFRPAVSIMVDKIDDLYYRRAKKAIKDLLEKS